MKCSSRIKILQKTRQGNKIFDKSKYKPYTSLLNTFFWIIIHLSYSIAFKDSSAAKQKILKISQNLIKRLMLKHLLEQHFLPDMIFIFIGIWWNKRLMCVARTKSGLSYTAHRFPFNLGENWGDHSINFYHSTIVPFGPEWNNQTNLPCIVPGLAAEFFFNLRQEIEARFRDDLANVFGFVGPLIESNWASWKIYFFFYLQILFLGSFWIILWYLIFFLRADKESYLRIFGKL